MGFTLKVTLKTERKIVVMLSTRPIARWCEACGEESSFVDERIETRLSPVSNEAHRSIIEGREYLCLRSISAQP